MKSIRREGQKRGDKWKMKREKREVKGCGDRESEALVGERGWVKAVRGGIKGEKGGGIKGERGEGSKATHQIYLASMIFRPAPLNPNSSITSNLILPSPFPHRVASTHLMLGSKISGLV